MSLDDVSNNPGFTLSLLNVLSSHVVGSTTFDLNLLEITSKCLDSKDCLPFCLVISHHILSVQPPKKLKTIQSFITSFVKSFNVSSLSDFDPATLILIINVATIILKVDTSALSESFITKLSKGMLSISPSESLFLPIKEWLFTAGLVYTNSMAKTILSCILSLLSDQMQKRQQFLLLLLLESTLFLLNNSTIDPAVNSKFLTKIIENSYFGGYLQDTVVYQPLLRKKILALFKKLADLDFNFSTVFKQLLTIIREQLNHAKTDLIGARLAGDLLVKLIPKISEPSDVVTSINSALIGVINELGLLLSVNPNSKLEQELLFFSELFNVLSEFHPKDCCLPVSQLPLLLSDLGLSSSRIVIGVLNTLVKSCDRCKNFLCRSYFGEFLKFSEIFLVRNSLNDLSSCITLFSHLLDNNYNISPVFSSNVLKFFIQSFQMLFTQDLISFDISTFIDSFCSIFFSLFLRSILEILLPWQSLSPNLFII
ncbi:hypothetical protein GEMRC1_012541 [Eukaryota sp. GEM-RC1]